MLICLSLQDGAVSINLERVSRVALEARKRLRNPWHPSQAESKVERDASGRSMSGGCQRQPHQNGKQTLSPGTHQQLHQPFSLELRPPVCRIGG